MNQEQLRVYWRKKKKEYRKNPENRAKDTKYNRDYYQRTDIKKATIVRLKKYRLTDKYKKWLIGNREKRNASQRKRRAENPIVRLHYNMSRCIYESLKAKGIVKRRRKWVSIVGYNLIQLKKHLESKFKKGMTWNNYGKWHVDHIIPRSKFNIISMDCEEIRKCWALSNLQPLWKIENLKKGIK